MAEKPFLHLGDLVQLNSIHPEKWYKIHSLEPVFSVWSERREDAEDSLRAVLNDLKADGACNVGYLPKVEEYLRKIQTSYQCFGTPVRFDNQATKR